MTSSFKRWQRVDLYMLDMVESECVGACMCVTFRWQYRNQSYQNGGTYCLHLPRWKITIPNEKLKLKKAVRDKLY